jgi:hypothetical protein
MNSSSTDMWKDKIRKQLKQGIREKAIDKHLAEYIREELKNDLEFFLVYNSTREMYVRIQYK